MSVADWGFLAVAGFLLGSLAYLARLTVRIEPWSTRGYAVIGVGVVILNVAGLWLQFHVDASSWYLAGNTLGYSVVAVGLVLLARARRRHLPDRTRLEPDELGERRDESTPPP